MTTSRITTTPHEPPLLVSRLAMAVVDVARHEIGQGEAGRNNCGPQVVRYRRGIDDAAAWCAAFVSFCIEEAATKLRIKLPHIRSHSARTLIENLSKVPGAVWSDVPAVGAIALWRRGEIGGPFGHVGIVETILDASGFGSIEANRGGYPSKVRRYVHEIGEPMLLGFMHL